MGAERCVVRVGNPKLGRSPLLQKDSEIVPLYPERLVAEEIFSLTRVPGVGKARFFADGRLVFLQARPSVQAAIYGRPLKDLTGPDKWILTGVRRAAGIFIPLKRPPAAAFIGAFKRLAILLLEGLVPFRAAIRLLPPLSVAWMNRQASIYLSRTSISLSI